MTSFIQDGPILGNQYDEDHLLRAYLAQAIPPEARGVVERDLCALGSRVVGDILQWGREAERDEPRLVSFDPWGRRIDRIETSPAWSELNRVSAEEGLVAIAYERPYGAASRIYQFAKLYLFHMSSAVYTCPLAMTDGGARLIELYGDEQLRRDVLPLLTTRDPERFWTSGQWMTERTGGSDVGRTETIARREDGGYRLYGTKWFTSAMPSQAAMTLARVEDEQGDTTAGSRGLSLFYLETCDAAGNLNGIEITRLKDKLGTRALPTAELDLVGTPAQLIGEPGCGVRQIASLLNITRIYNALGAVAGMRRAVALARDYASRREAFGRPLAEHALHLETLAELEVEFEAGFHFVFRTVELLGRDECGEATRDEQALLRILTPLVKLYTAKQSVAVVSEVLECFGGAGYVEDTALPRMLRDAQVSSIWEGTTNVLSLDTLRAMQREGALRPLLDDVSRLISDISHPALEPLVEQIDSAARRVEEWLTWATDEEPAALVAGARGFAYSLARIYMAALLTNWAQSQVVVSSDARAVAAAQRWCGRELAPLTRLDHQRRAAARALALGDPLSEAEPAATRKDDRQHAAR